jgi:GT2 family glycosyltransferase
MPMGAPFVSIGLPVFNGEKYLESSLDSLLSQDYANFELIISDNASTDRTAQILSDPHDGAACPCTVMSRHIKLGGTRVSAPNG